MSESEGNLRGIWLKTGVDRVPGIAQGVTAGGVTSIENSSG